MVTFQDVDFSESIQSMPSAVVVFSNSRIACVFCSFTNCFEPIFKVKNTNELIYIYIIVAHFNERASSFSDMPF